jgi:hypothetical protein
MPFHYLGDWGIMKVISAEGDGRYNFYYNLIAWLLLYANLRENEVAVFVSVTEIKNET